MQDDLKERLRTQADAMMFNDCLEPCTMREAADRIAALEAKLAEKDALLRECGEALGRIVENEDQYGMTWAAEVARATLAKIKDATDAD